MAILALPDEAGVPLPVGAIFGEVCPGKLLKLFNPHWYDLNLSSHGGEVACAFKKCEPGVPSRCE